MTVTVNEPGLEADTVSTVDPVPPELRVTELVELEPKVAVTEGSDVLAVSVTVPANPPSDVNMTVELPELPALIGSDDGLALIVKSGGGGDEVTTTDTEVAAEIVPLVPVTVMV